ncbi:MAG: hypothetical protein HY801_12830, partial [Candidatus Lindowbacteria bacterium]|nr:hypothetical protein [Candidatus Lindowbacteria bacterium]
MELAVHIRKPGCDDCLKGIQKHLAGLYDATATRGVDRPKERDGPIDRIYLGDEFCVNRLPILGELEALIEFARANDKKITFLTPPLTDGELDACSSLFDCLSAESPEAEVVVNNVGVLFFLKKK